jgi:CheY-like chemotaxis protein
MVELLMQSQSVELPGQGSVRPPRILVVDDNQDAAHTLARLLKVLGLDAVAAYCGKTAIEEIERCPPALVFLDLCMPEMDGVETAARIRQCNQGQAITLVALTGFGEAEEGARIRAAGFACHLTKPLQITVLEQTLVEYLGYRADAYGADNKSAKAK